MAKLIPWLEVEEEYAMMKADCHSVNCNKYWNISTPFRARYQTGRFGWSDWDKSISFQPSV
jgi:hypothetical protein